MNFGHMVDELWADNRFPRFLCEKRANRGLVEISIGTLPPGGISSLMAQYDGYGPYEDDQTLNFRFRSYG